MIKIVLIIAIVVITSITIYDICQIKKEIKSEKFEKQNKQNVYVENPETKEKQLNPIIIQKIMNDDYYISGTTNANNVGIRARLYDHFKPDRLDMKNVKKDLKKKN
jgi:hypothetical protein